MSIKAKLKPWIPPVVLDTLRSRSAIIRLSGDYASWSAAKADATGYDSDEILNRVVAATRKVVSGEARFERDSVAFDQVEYSWPLLACLLQVALERRSLRVIDFGGALGSTLRQNWAFLRRLHVPLSWRVVEQEQFVAVGRREFSTDVLGFDDTIPEAAREGADAVLFASSLCYVAEPELFLRQAESSGAAFLLIDRLPVLDGPSDRIALQSVSEPIYSASYPVRMFAEQNLLGRRLAAWRLIESWDCDLQPDGESRSRGYFLEKR